MSKRMSIRERILATVHGCPDVEVPFTIYAGLLLRGQAERELRELGLALQVQMHVYHCAYPHVEIERRVLDGGGERTIHTIYCTPVGEAELVQRVRADAGYGSAWTKSPLIKDLKDYEVMRYVIDDAVYTPNYDGLKAMEEQIGEDGIVLGSVDLSPFQTLVNPDWLGMDGVSYWLADHPAEFDELYEALARAQARIYQLAAGAPVELIHTDENVTAMMEGPRLFQRYHLPFYQRLAPQLHAAGKLYVAHFDGSIRPLRDLLGASPIDVVEAFTPPPMGDFSVREAKEAWPQKIIWSNFPGSIFLESDENIRSYTSDLLDEAAGGRFILGITEDIPEDLWVRGLRAIAAELKRRWP